MHPVAHPIVLHPFKLSVTLTHLSHFENLWQTNQICHYSAFSGKHTFKPEQAFPWTSAHHRTSSISVYGTAATDRLCTDWNWNRVATLAKRIRQQLLRCRYLRLPPIPTSGSSGDNPKIWFMSAQLFLSVWLDTVHDRSNSYSSAVCDGLLAAGIMVYGTEWGRIVSGIVLLLRVWLAGGDSAWRVKGGKYTAHGRLLWGFGVILVAQIQAC